MIDARFEMVSLFLLNKTTKKKQNKKANKSFLNSSFLSFFLYQFDSFLCASSVNVVDVDTTPRSEPVAFLESRIDLCCLFVGFPMATKPAEENQKKTK